jgi:ABC-type tungstate transport system substrate-binding protein
MSTIAALPANLRDLVLRAFTDSLSNVFLTAVPILIIAFILSLFLKDVRLRGAGDREIPTLVE